MDPSDVPESQPGILIVGGGLAGQTAALFAAEHANVLLISSAPLNTSSSAWAQGGIAAALSELDSPEAHFQDTLKAGRGLCNERAVEMLVREAPGTIEQLVRWGVDFERDSQSLSLGLEGGHSQRRIVHARGAATGQAIMESLTSRVLSHPNIEVRTGIELLRLEVEAGGCMGAWIVDHATGDMKFISADSVILALGGASGLYERTTNPSTCRGQGIAVAYSAGAEMADLEFVQFHPTALADENAARALLISEAVRGEGAHLLNGHGERFMCDEHPLAELAPRDVVARAVAREIEATGGVSLSLNHLDAERVRAKFYSLCGALAQCGYDLARDEIPVAPAAHYTIGGIRTDLDGATNIRGLYACGEVASTGVHGANRLASNSLLECSVFGRRAAVHAIEHSSARRLKIERRAQMRTATTRERARLIEIETRLRGLMGHKVGLIRSQTGLNWAQTRLRSFQNEVEGFGLSFERERVVHQLLTAKLIARGALKREETRGAHARRDFPREEVRWQRSNIQRRELTRSLVQTTTS